LIPKIKYRSSAIYHLTVLFHNFSTENVRKKKLLFTDDICNIILVLYEWYL